MKLYLVRHGEALDGMDDCKRALSPLGQSKITATGEFLAKSNLNIQSIYHSSKVRAHQTATILGAHIAPKLTPIEQEGLMPNDAIPPMLQMIQTLKDDTMLVGHLPYMAELASRLVTQTPDGVLFQFQPGNILCLESMGYTWSVVWFLDSSLCS